MTSATPDAPDDANGVVYCTARSGLPGPRDELDDDAFRIFERLPALDAAPALLGFGINTPEHVRRAIQAGAAGAISGSAVVEAIEKRLESGDDLAAAVHEPVRAMVRAAS